MKIMKIGILGLGYVGIPLFNALRRHYDVIGYDLDKKKIQNLIQKKKFKGFITSNYLHLKDSNN